MYSDLIIGYDGSDAGRDALALGRRLALAIGARPTVVAASAGCESSAGCAREFAKLAGAGAKPAAPHA